VVLHLIYFELIRAQFFEVMLNLNSFEVMLNLNFLEVTHCHSIDISTIYEGSESGIPHSGEAH
jgi:hypothetical protein